MQTINTFFDKIFVVNLAHAADKKYKILNQLRKFQIEFEIWPATNGYNNPHLQNFTKYYKSPLGNLHFQKFNQLEVQRGSKFISSAGAWGYLVTYINLLQHCLQKGYESVLILEDDVLLDLSFERKFAGSIANIPSDWKVIQLGASQYHWENVDITGAEKQGYYHPRIIDTCGSFALGLHNSVFQELITFLSLFESPFDLLPMGELYEKYLSKCFVVYPFIVVPDVTSSTIRNPRDQFEHAKLMKWEMGNFAFPHRKPLLCVLSASATPFVELSNNSDISSLFDLIFLILDHHNGFRPMHSINQQSLDSSVPTSDLYTLFDESYSRITNYTSECDIIIKLYHPNQAITSSLLLEIVNNIFQTGHYHNTSTGIEGHYINASHVNDTVSVIIPTKGRSASLKTSIESVLLQSYDNIELVIVDDNGDDHQTTSAIQKIINEYTNKEIHYIKHPNSVNGAAARNTGLLQCRGSFISFLDDDDIYLPDKVRLSLDALNHQDPLYGGVYCGYKGWNSSGNDFTRFREGNLQYVLLTLDYSKHYLNTDTALYRKTSLVRINGFDETLVRHQDLDLNIRFFDNFLVCCSTGYHVEINPSNSPRLHQISGIGLLELKKTFLAKFGNTISTYSDSERQYIYLQHARELIRYLGSEQAFVAAAVNDEDPISFLLLDAFRKAKQSPSLVHSGIHEIPQRNMPTFFSGIHTVDSISAQQSTLNTNRNNAYRLPTKNALQVKTPFSRKPLIVNITTFDVLPFLVFILLSFVLCSLLHCERELMIMILTIESFISLGLLICIQLLRTQQKLYFNLSNDVNFLSDTVRRLVTYDIADLKNQLRKSSESIMDLAHDRDIRYPPSAEDVAKTTYSLISPLVSNSYRQFESLIYLMAKFNNMQALPVLSDWSISPDLAKLLYDSVQNSKPTKILSLGSGASDIIIGESLRKNGHGILISLEHMDSYFIKAMAAIQHYKLSENIRLELCPLKSYSIQGSTYMWYDIEQLTDLQGIDLLVIDGPPGDTNQHARYPAIPLLYNFLNKGAIVVVDDAKRKQDHDVVMHWTQSFHFASVRYLDTEKGTFILNL